MSHTHESQDESARRPGAVTTALSALRLPIALALLAYLVLDFLISLGRIISGGRGIVTSAGPGFAERAASQQSTFLSPLTLILLVLLVAIVAAREPIKLARPVVLTALVLTGVGLLFGLVGLLSAFFVDSRFGFNTTRDKIEQTLLDLPVLALYVLFALFLLALLGAKGLPRTPKPQRSQQYGQQYPGASQGGIPGFPPLEQQPYGYQQPPQSQAHDPWQGYPQQGYQQQQPYQQEPQYQQPPQQPWQQQRPAEQSPYQQPQQPPYRQQDPPAGAREPSTPVDVSKHEDSSEDRPNTAPPAPSWPQQPSHTQPLPESDSDKAPDEARDWYTDQRRNDSPDPPPPYSGWSGPHL